MACLRQPARPAVLDEWPIQFQQLFLDQFHDDVREDRLAHRCGFEGRARGHRPAALPVSRSHDFRPRHDSLVHNRHRNAGERHQLHESRELRQKSVGRDPGALFFATGRGLEWKRPGRQGRRQWRDGQQLSSVDHGVTVSTRTSRPACHSGRSLSTFRSGRRESTAAAFRTDPFRQPSLREMAMEGPYPHGAPPRGPAPA